MFVTNKDILDKTSVEAVDTKSSDNNTEVYITKDEILLFNLKVISNINKYDKLKYDGVFISIDDRLLLQGLRRWYTGDNKNDMITIIIGLINKIDHRVKSLLSQMCDNKQSDTHPVSTMTGDIIGSKANVYTASTSDPVQSVCIVENDNIKQSSRRILSKYIFLLTPAKRGIENLKFYTYSDNLTQNKFDLILTKIEDMLYYISKYHYIES